MGNEKVRENRLRRTAERRGYTLTKSRRRDKLALDYGTWQVKGKDAPKGSLTLDELEAFLSGGTNG